MYILGSLLNLVSGLTSGLLDAVRSLASLSLHILTGLVNLLLDVSSSVLHVRVVGHDRRLQ